MPLYYGLSVLGVTAVGLSALLSYRISITAFVLTILAAISSLLITYIITRRVVEEEAEEKVKALEDRHNQRIRRLKKEHDTTTLEKTIRDGTRTLIKNALDYFKIENIKNEMRPSAAIQNLQLDKYGQIIELLADFSLILPDYQENQQIVEQEINHQIDIYKIDEKAFALFLQRIMDKYMVTVDKKIREKADMNMLESIKTCPRCAERVLLKATVCKHCGYEFKPAAKSSVQGTLALDRVEKGKEFYRSGQIQAALNSLTGAIELKPNYAIAYYNRAIVYKKLGDLKQCEIDLRHAAYLGHKKAQEMLKALEDSQVRARTGSAVQTDRDELLQSQEK
jgi:tetratricopeptide (TPR) repeat protein